MNVLISSLSTNSEDPRPARLSKYLSQKGIAVTWVNCMDATSVDSGSLKIIGIPNQKKITKENFGLKILNYALYIIKKIISISLYKLFPKTIGQKIYSKNLVNSDYRNFLKKELSYFHTVIVFDLVIMPFIVPYKSEGSRLIYEVREFYQGQKSMYFMWDFIYAKLVGNLEKKYIKFADEITTVSHGLSKLLSEIYHLPNYPQVIFGVPFSEESEFTIKKNDNQLLFHGHVNYDRGIHNVIPALANLENYKIIIRGYIDRDYKEYLLKIARRTQVEELLIFEEPVEYRNLLRKTAESTYGLLPWLNFYPQKSLSMPNKLFEYIAAGTPVICVENSDAAHLVEQNGLGIVYDGSCEDLVYKIKNTSIINYQKFLINLKSFNKTYSYEYEMMKYDKILKLHI